MRTRGLLIFFLVFGFLLFPIGAEGDPDLTKVKMSERQRFYDLFSDTISNEGADDNKEPIFKIERMIDPQTFSLGVSLSFTASFSNMPAQNTYGEHAYRADWPLEVKVEENGSFQVIERNAIHLVRIDAEKKTETAVLLKDWSSYDDLREAVRANDINKVSQLLKSGLSAIDEDRGDELVETAAHNSSWNLVDLLVNNMKPVDGDLILCFVENYHQSSFDNFVSKASNFEDKWVYWAFNSLFENPAGTLVVWNDKVAHIIRAIKAAGVSLNATDAESGNSILFNAVQLQMPLSFLNKLVAAGADPDQKNKAGVSALDLAVKEKQISVIKLIDQKHRYGALVKRYDIPLKSPFVGKWEGDYTVGILELDQDGTGALEGGMIGGMVLWTQDGQSAHVSVYSRTNDSSPIVIIAGKARLNDDPKGLTITTEKTPLSYGDEGTEMNFEKAKNVSQ